jgi:hypothetical protein
MLRKIPSSKQALGSSFSIVWQRGVEVGYFWWSTIRQEDDDASWPNGSWSNDRAASISRDPQAPVERQGHAPRHVTCPVLGIWVSWSNSECHVRLYNVQLWHTHAMPTRYVPNSPSLFVVCISSDALTKINSTDGWPFEIFGKIAHSVSRTTHGMGIRQAAVRIKNGHFCSVLDQGASKIHRNFNSTRRKRRKFPPRFLCDRRTRVIPDYA